MNEKIALKVSKVSILINVLLSIGKLLAGIIGHSNAMISDAIHSASDVFSTIVVIIGVKAASKKADQNHQYGHERMECVAAIFLSSILAFTGLMIGYQGFMNILHPDDLSISIPGLSALIAAIISIAVKEGMYWYTRNNAKKINSSALMADAWHHRSDALSSIGAFIGILGARLGYVILEPIATEVISCCIIKAAYDIFMDAINKMVDKSCSKEVENQMKEVICSQEGVLRVDLLHTRLFGSKVYVDVEISTDGTLSLKEAHTIAENVHRSIEKNFKNVKHCNVHVNPM